MLDADLKAQIRAFREDSVAPLAALWERQRRIGAEGIAAAAAIGLTGIEVPIDDGGLGLPFSAKAAIAEEIARSCFAFSFSLINTQNVASKLSRDGTPAQRRRFLPDLLAGRRLGCTALTEPAAGSDFAAITTSAEKVDGGYRLNGEKAWITNAALADVIVLFAQTDPTAGWRGIACFLIDGTQPGFYRQPAFELAGGHAIGAGGFRLENYFCPESDLLHPPGLAFKQAMRSINGARTYVAAMCCGMVAEALDIALAYGARRTSFGKSLIEHQGLRWSLVDVATQLEAARLLVDKAASLIDRDQDAVLAAAYAKKFAGEMALAALGVCMQAMGAEGLRDRYPIGRHLVAARIANYVDGSTEMQNERIGALLSAGARG